MQCTKLVPCRQQAFWHACCRIDGPAAPHCRSSQDQGATARQHQGDRPRCQWSSGQGCRPRCRAAREQGQPVQPEPSGIDALHPLDGSGATPQAQPRPAELQPPLAPRIPHQLCVHGHTRQDDWYWLRDEGGQSDQLRLYLASEQAYCRAVLSEVSAVQTEISQQLEQVAWQRAMRLTTTLRLRELVDGGQAGVDAAVARRSSLLLATPPSGTMFGGYQYVRTGVAAAHGRLLEQHLRVCEHDANTPQPTVQVMLDEHVRSRGRPGYRLGMLLPSPDCALIAFTEADDAVPGRPPRLQHYTLHVQCADTGQPVVVPISGARGVFAWSPDGRMLFYTSGRCLGSVMHTLHIPTQPASQTPQPTPRSDEPSRPAECSLSDPDGLQFAFRQLSFGAHIEHQTGDGGTCSSHVLLCEAIDSELRAREVWAWLPRDPRAPESQTQPAASTLASRLPPAGQSTEHCGDDNSSSSSSRRVTRDDSDVLNGRHLEASVADEYSWQLVVPRTPGSRVLLHVLPQSSTAVMCHWDAQQPNGQVYMCDVRGSGHNQGHVQLPVTLCAPPDSSQQRVAWCHQLLLPERPEWRILGFQTQGTFLLVMLLSTRHEVRAATPPAQQPCRDGHADDMQAQDVPTSSAPPASPSSMLRFEVYHITSAPVAAAAGIELVAEGWLEVPTPCVDVTTPVWIAAPGEPYPDQQQHSGTHDSRADQQHLLQSHQLTHYVECEVSSTCMPPQRALLQLSPPVSPQPAGSADLPAQETDDDDDDQGLAEGDVCHSMLYATSVDGTQVPVTLSYQLQPARAGAGDPRPVVLLVYGAYGRDAHLSYESHREVLLSRGWGVAVAHVRGGGGPASVGSVGNPAWHLAGSLEHKRQGVHDLLAAAQLLVKCGWGVQGQVCLASSSAGAWVAGAALNTLPHLFQAAVLTVPSLDILTTTCDDADSVHELGDALVNASAYQAMLGWSPVDTIPQPEHLVDMYLSAGLDKQPRAGKARLFPHLLVRIALQDTSVQVWEAVKYVAKLRHVVQDAQQHVLPGTQHVRLPVVVTQLAEQGGHDAFEDGEGQAHLAGFLVWCAEYDTGEMPAVMAAS